MARMVRLGVWESCWGGQLQTALKKVLTSARNRLVLLLVQLAATRTNGTLVLLVVPLMVNDLTLQSA